MAQRFSLVELFSQYGADLLASARRITGSDADAEEAVAQTFSALLKRKGRLDPACDPGAYLSRAVVNRSLNQLRRRRRAPGPLPESLESKSASRDDRRDVLRRGIASLSPRQAEVFTLRHLEGRAIDAIACDLAIAPATVRVHLHAATKSLRRRFDPKEAGKLFEPQGSGTNAFVMSSAMKKRFGTHAVVLTFQVPFARGSVVHSQAHIAQKPEHASTEAIAGMHRLTLNTILEATK